MDTRANNIKSVSAYLLLMDNNTIEDNSQVINYNLDEYVQRAENLLKAYYRLYNIYWDTYNDTFNECFNEQGAQTLMYDIGKEIYPENKLRDFFKDIYLLLFRTETGPRLGTFISLYGIENFLELFKQKITDPFDLK